MEQKREPRCRPLHIWPLDKRKVILQISGEKNEFFSKWFWDSWLSIWEIVTLNFYPHQFSSVQLLSRVRLFVTPWTAACQASLSITNSWGLLKLISIELMMPSNHIILCPLPLPPSILPSIRVFYKDQSLQASGSFPKSQHFAWGGQSTGDSASASVLPLNIQDWFPLGWTSLISLQWLLQ